MQETMNIVTVGHVDHGKSTVIGRLLADSHSLPEGKLDAVRENCRRNSKPFEYAFLLDALKNEQAQGITIDTARCFFHTEKRHYIILDAPGHIEFLKNMVTGASRADAALLVIDAARGVEENTRRHGYFLSMLGIRQVAVLVNKMDLVDYSEAVFRDIRREYERFLAKIDIRPQAFLPVSGFAGDNIAVHSAQMPWYRGLTVLEQLDAFTATAPPHHLSLRMPVQGVYKFTANEDHRRIVAGQVETGELAAGDALIFLPSGKKTTVKTLERFPQTTQQSFGAGEAAGFTMQEQIYVKRGEVACRENDPLPQVGVRLRCNLFWLGKRRLQTGRTYLLKCGTAKVEMNLEKVERVVNASDLSCFDRQYVERNEVAECVLSLEHPIAFELPGGADCLNRFVIVDDYEISGGGIITEGLAAYDYDTRNIRWSGSGVSAEMRERMLGHRGLVVWMTGLSGSGKSTIAELVERRLIEQGISCYVLDGDKLRRGVNADLGFSDADRSENIRRTAEIARLFQDAGLVTLVTLISPFRSSRAEARRISRGPFLEVYVRAELETCIKRDPKQLYKKALAGNLRSFTGIDSGYEAPENPDLLLDTEKWSEEECAEALFSTILRQIAD